MNDSPSVKVALFIRNGGSESPCRWFFFMDINIENMKKKNKQDYVMAVFEYSPCDDWSIFYDAGYYLKFDIVAFDGIKAFQLEIKDEEHTEILKRKIIVNHFTDESSFSIKSGSSNKEAWKKVSQMCFTVFFDESYLSGEKGTLWIQNLRMSVE